jgi:predicted DNA-binding transcriptional regulator AlpA
MSETTEKKKRQPTKVAPAPTDAPVFSADDLAALLRVSLRQVYTMRQRGQIPAPSKVPGLGLRWSRLTIEAWLADQLAA